MCGIAQTAAGNLGNMYTIMPSTLSLTRLTPRTAKALMPAVNDQKTAPVQRGVLCQDTPNQPNGRTFIRLLTAFRDSGGTAPGDVVGRLLAEYQCSRTVSLSTLIEQHRVFSFEWRGCRWFPMFQFELSDWSLKSGPYQVWKTLPPEMVSWAIAVWFATPNWRLEGHIPANLLDTDLVSVVAAASLAQHGS
jgi:hypothetical protein